MRAILASILLLTGSAAVGENSGTIVQLGSRLFDVRMAASELRRDDDFIPVSDIDWLRPALEADPIFDGVVFHIRSTSVPASRSWNEPGSEGNVSRAYDGSKFYNFEGFDAWLLAPESARIFYLVPDRPAEFSATCGLTSSGDKVALCVLYASYPMDPHILLQARIYFPRPMERRVQEFDILAKEMRTIAACLDVTDGSRPSGPCPSR